MHTTDIAPDVRAVLDRATFEGTVLKLPDQLPRPLYERVDKTLGALGARWNRSARGHVFGEGAVVDYLIMMESGKVPPRNGKAFYPTPQPIVHQMLELARVWELATKDTPLVLEPSAGDGAIACEVMALYPFCTVHCVEVDEERASELRREPSLRHVWQADFLTWTPAAAAYDRVIMNPPFRVEDDPTAWITHVRRGLALLKPDGILVSVVPNGYLHRSDKKHTSFRDAVATAASTRHLEPDAFSDSGASVNTLLLLIDASALQP